MKETIWIEVSKNNLKHNLQMLRRLIGKKILAPAVKANAYGHGLIETAKLLIKFGADWLCVNSVAEEEKLRQSKIKKPILIIGCVAPEEFKKVVAYDLRLFVYDIISAKRLSRLAVAKHKKVKIHFKIDTGMHRQGVQLEQAESLVQKIAALPGLEIEGLATHFASADNPRRPAYFKKQSATFKILSARIKEILGKKLIVHCDKSASILLYPDKLFDLVRPGIAVYGHFPAAEIEKICQKRKIHLRPALSLKTKISFVKKIPKNSLVGYGCSFKTKRPTTIALLPIGYYDGLDRGLSNRGWVLVAGQKAPIIGRICMNITIIDVTDIKNISAGTEATIIGKQKNQVITAENLAEQLGTINYEIIARLRESISRYYL